MLHCISIGCKVNQAEVSEIRNKYKKSANASLTNGQTGVGCICLINTCAVTNTSEAKSRKIIRRLIRENPNYRFIITGCFVDAQPEAVRKLVRKNDIIVSNTEKSKIPELITGITGVSKRHSAISAVSHDKGATIQPDIAESIEQAQHYPSGKSDVFPEEPFARTRAFLKIQDGCNQFCSYCIVPFLRSILTSKPVATVIDEAKELAAKGYQEIVLTGVNLGKHENLIEILRRITQISGLKRIRISSIELNDISDELIDLIAQSQKICPHLHIPLQSGSDRILELMKRNYRAADFISRINLIKKKIANPSLTTDVIVGFPGESETDFNETIALCRKVGFSKIHIFTFSPRKGTVAAQMRDQIPPPVIKKRFNLLNNVANDLALLYKQSFFGSTVDVLMEDNNEGFTDRYIRVKVKHAGSETPVQPLRAGAAARHRRQMAGWVRAEQTKNKIVKVKINSVCHDRVTGNIETE